MNRLSKSACVALVLSLWAGFLPGGFGCQSSPSSPNTSSETHFLRWCPTSGSCGGGLECVCRVCAGTCVSDDDCAPLAAGAVCVQTASRPMDQACGQASIEASCELPCSADAECAPLGDAHRCDRGFCRALAADCATGSVRGGEVALLGDSFIAVRDELQLELERLARSAGALAADESYRDHSTTAIVPFGAGNDLVSQYEAALADQAPRVVVTNIGGPDALVSCPDPPTEACPALANAAAGAEALFARMSSGGVDAVVVLFYPDPADAALVAKLDVLRPMIQAACAQSPAPCHFVDLRSTFAGRETELLEPDGLVPTAAGAVATARAAWSTLQEHCIAQ